MFSPLKLIRRLFKTVFIILIVIALLIAALLLGADYLLKRGIEDGGSYALGVDTRAKRVSIEFIDGDLTINELLIKNPDGFDTPHLMQFKKLDLSLDSASVLAETIDINHFVIESLNVNVEFRLTDSNVGKVMEHVESIETGKGDDDDDDDDDAPGGKRVRVDTILIKDTVAYFQVTGMEDVPILGKIIGAGKAVTVTIPEIELNNVTSDNPDGVLVHELFLRIVPKILEGILTRGAQQGFKIGDILSGPDAPDFGVGIEMKDLPADESADPADGDGPSQLPSSSD